MFFRTKEYWEMKEIADKWRAEAERGLVELGRVSKEWEDTCNLALERLKENEENFRQAIEVCRKHEATNKLLLETIDILQGRLRKYECQTHMVEQ